MIQDSWLHPPLEVLAGWLTCRRVQMTDSDALYEAVVASSEHLRPWMPWAASFTPEATREFVERNAAHPGAPAAAEAAYLVIDHHAEKRCLI